MSWHFEILTVNARRFKPGESYENRDEFASILTIQFENQKRAYISGLLNDGTKGPIHRSDYRDLRDGLRTMFGVELMEGEHSRQPLSIETKPTDFGSLS